MGRIDFFHQPGAPLANVIVVAALVVVRDEAGRVLLVERSDTGRWAPPGGAQEVGERVAAAAEREAFEETGYQVRVTELSGVYSDPDHVIAYDDGEVRQEFALCFRADLVSGSSVPSNETKRVEWVRPEDLDDHPMDEWIRLRVDHALAPRSSAYIG
jgi:8-oxo-dGTP pyrophosphatase MutT (NUDIX family)